MAYVKRKQIKGREYYYLAESYRAGSKVKTRTLAYLGTTAQNRGILPIWSGSAARSLSDYSGSPRRPGLPVHGGL